MINIRKLEAELWESADLLRQGSKLTSNQYCMPVLALLFLRYAYSRYKLVEAEILKDRPSRGGRVMPVEPSDFEAKSALYLPREAQFDFLVNLPDNITSAGLKNKDGQPVNSLGEAVNNAMQLVEEQSEQLTGVLPKTYTMFADDLLRELLRIFNNKTIDEVGGDIIGRIYEYFLSKFAKAVASDDGVFFTPKSLVKMLVNVLEPEQGVMLDPACGSGGMFVQTGDFVNAAGMNANTQMTFFGQEKVEYNAQLCLMNMAVHGLNGRIVSGDEANSFYHDAFNLAGKCDYVIANPPFNVDKVKSESAFSAGRAGFVMASSATDSSNKDRDIREQLVKTGHVDVMVSVGNNFFYTLSLPCSLWFFDKAKREENRDKVLFIDARKYYTVVDRTLNEWTEWQLLNLQAIVHLYRGETEKYQVLLEKYNRAINEAVNSISENAQPFASLLDDDTAKQFNGSLAWLKRPCDNYEELSKNLNGQIEQTKSCVKLAEERLKKRELKSMRLAGDKFCKVLEEILTIIEEHEWLTGKFGKGEYHDIAGLCKIATLDEIEEKNYSLTPGAYVGVPEAEDDGVDFHERMNEIHAELAKLHEEANVLMKDILNDWETLK